MGVCMYHETRALLSWLRLPVPRHSSATIFIIVFHLLPLAKRDGGTTGILGIASEARAPSESLPET